MEEEPKKAAGEMMCHEVDYELIGGEGFILQRLRGDGMAFVHAGGTVIKKW
ncbi:MAG: AIM24 family protein [Candidatus Desulfatibia sp.]|uniref:AIM24 family protein n=1 Tax=Candidatus Desulfatibia sp. TaxID=3101189 RepID=UPI002F3010F2